MIWTSFKWIKIRILILSVGFVLFLCLILFRSYQLHILENKRVNRLASVQYSTTLPIQLKRGTIFDRNGEPLALDVQVASIAIHPTLIEDKDFVIDRLSSILGIPSLKIAPQIYSNKQFYWIERRIPSEIGQKIEDLKLKGVSIIPEYRRYYPNKELAGNVLGAVGYDAKALGGLELSLDSFLKSNATSKIVQKDAKGRLYTPLPEEDSHNNVYLTLDRNIQFIAEKYLWESAIQYKVNYGFAIVMDTASGEILAMANYPSFNPNTYWTYKQDTWKNHAVVASYEPGSTFKGIAAAAAIKQGKIKPEDVFYCEKGSYKVGNKIIHDHGGYGNLTFADIIRVSSNIGVTKIIDKVGKESFYETITQLGFGQKTGILFPGEDQGRLLPSQKWTQIDTSNIAFGQGIAVNGVQMVQAYATFANSGIRMRPYLISKIINSENRLVQENQPTMVQQILDEVQAKKLTKLLEGTVTTTGTGQLANLDGYSVAGKTGTAQKVDPKTKNYDNKNFVSSFIGYVPANKPQFVIYVVYDSPKPVYYGGVVAAPVFRKIAQETLAYRGVPPEEIKLARSTK